MIQFKMSSTGFPNVEKKLDSLTQGLTREEAKRVGSEAVGAMKDLISKGLSPVRGGGVSTRFEAYKDPTRYPGKRKSSSPVNLKLTGAFLKDLGYAIVSRAKGWGAEVGYSDPKQIVKEQGHREGANGQPSRPTIPDASRGERFARTVEDVYLKIIQGAIRRRTE